MESRKTTKRVDRPPCSGTFASAGDLERVNIVAAKLHHRIRGDDNERRLDHRARGRVDIGHEQRRKKLRDFRKLDRGACAFVRWAIDRDRLVGVGIGDERID